MIVIKKAPLGAFLCSFLDNVVSGSIGGSISTISGDVGFKTKAS